jgi:hypothetical protein
LHEEELRDLYCSPNIIIMVRLRRMRLAGYVTRIGEVTNAYRVLVGNPEGKRRRRITRRKWEYNIKTDLSETG